MTESRGTFAIAVLGAMNPSIHTPDWYHYLGLITPEELAAAKKDPSFMCTRVASQFSCGTLMMNCTELKWIVRAAQSDIARATEFASKTFTALDQTPISAYGVNYDYHVDLGIEVSLLLGSHVGSTLGFDEAERSTIVGGSLRFRQTLEKRDLNVTIEPSPLSPQWISVAMNYHCAIVAEEWQHFDLAKLMQASVSEDGRDAPKRLDRVLKVIRARTENK